MQKPIAVINQTATDSLSDEHMMLLAVQLVASFLYYYPIHHDHRQQFRIQYCWFRKIQILAV